MRQDNRADIGQLDTGFLLAIEEYLAEYQPEFFCPGSMH